MTYPELYILRHGETVWNAENRMQGWLNSPLTPRGEQHAYRQREILQTCDLQGFRFWSSPAGRAIQTAGIACVMAETIHTDIRLREIGVGDWAGHLRDGLPQGEGPDPYLAQYDMAPNGEGTQAVRVRVDSFLAALDGPAVVVTHGITSRMIRAAVVGEAVLNQPSPNGGQGGVYHLKDGAQELLT